MKIKWLATLLLTGLAFQSQSQEADVKPEAPTPYDVIMDRNIFRLVALPCCCADEPAPLDLPTVKITGFSDSNGFITAFFATVPKDSKERPTYFALSKEARVEGILELVTIRGEEFDVLINGTPKTLSLKAH